MSIAVLTKFIGPTNHKPSRISAKLMTNGRRIIVSWDHELNVEQNHYAAARALVNKLDLGYEDVLTGCDAGTGMVVVFGD